MNVQASLPGCAATPMANRAALESDLRGEVSLAILAWIAWSDAHSDARKMLDGSISAWLTAGKPDDPGIARALAKLRSMLARYIDHGGSVPSWFPPELLKAIKEPSTDVQSAATATAPPSENTTTATSQRRHSVAKVPE